MNSVTKLYCFKKTFYHKNFIILNAQRSILPLPPITPYSLEKEKWNSGGETRIFHLNTITEHFAKCCEKQSGITLETWLGEKQTWFLMSGYFILTFSLLKSFSCPLPSRVLYRCQSGLEFFWWGLKMSTVIPEKWLWLQEVTWLMLKLAASFFWR